MAGGLEGRQGAIMYKAAVRYDDVLISCRGITAEQELHTIEPGRVARRAR